MKLFKFGALLTEVNAVTVWIEADDEASAREKLDQADIEWESVKYYGTQECSFDDVDLEQTMETDD